MRQPIVDALKAGVPEVQNRVFEAHAKPWERPEEAIFPFLVVVFGPSVKQGTWEALNSTFDVLVYTNMSTYQLSDTLGEKVHVTLNNLRFIDPTENPPNRRYIVHGTGAPNGDSIDDRWRAIYQTERFAVYPLGWLSSTISYEPDPVKGFMDLMGSVYPNVGTNPLTWDPGDASPAVYFRVSRIVGMLTERWGARATAEVKGHILVPDVTLRNDWVRRTIDLLATRRVVPLRDGGWFNITQTTADFEVDPFRAGQVTVHGTFPIQRIPAPADPLNHIFATQNGVVYPV